MIKKSQPGQELIFVYNVRSGLFNKLTDYAHKTLSPGTYACDLCSLTHGNLGMYREWEVFVQKLPLRASFQYKNQWPEFQTFPLVLLKSGEETNVLLDTGQLNAVNSLEELMDLLRVKLLVDS